MGSGPTARRRPTRRLLKLCFVMLSFAAVGLITTGSVLGEGQPSIASDQSDYAPSASVSLIGSGWLDGETVHVTVDDDQNDPWSHDVDLTAGDDGTVADSFDLPNVAGTYSVSATAPSGSASATFTATAPAPPPPPPAASPTLSSDESTYAPGSAVTLSGTNWTPGSTVHIVVDDDKSDAWDHIADVTAGANGSLSDTFELPTGLAATFTASATDSSDKNATATFTSVSAPPGSPTLDSDKETYAPGAQVTLSGTNWTPGSAVHIVVDDDKSDSWTHTADVAAGVDGKISDSFSLPSLSATFTATATGTLGQSATTTFSAGFGSATEHYLVRFASGTSTATQAQILASAGAEDNNYIAPLRIHGVLLPGGAGLQPSIDKLRSYQSVTRVEPDREREAGATPNDPDYGNQWSLPKIGWDNVFGETSVERFGDRRRARHRRRRFASRPRRQPRVRHVDSGRLQRPDRSERPRHCDGRDRRGRDRQRRGCRRNRFLRSPRHARHRARSRRHRPGLGHHRGRRLRGRSRRGRHPHVLLEPRILGAPPGCDRLRVGRTVSCSSRRPATTARPLRSSRRAIVA